MSELTIELLSRRNNKPTVWEMKGEKIKLCPFCGGDDICLVVDGDIHWCSCSDCAVEGPYGMNRLNAIQRWQTRI